MAQFKPLNWVLTTSQDFSSSGVLQLGQVLTDAFDPNSALLAVGTVPRPAQALRDQQTPRAIDFRSRTALKNASADEPVIVHEHYDYTSIDPESSTLRVEPALRDQQTPGAIDFRSRAALKKASADEAGLIQENYDYTTIDLESCTLRVELVQPDDTYANTVLRAVDASSNGLDIPWWKTNTRIFLVTGLRIVADAAPQSGSGGSTGGTSGAKAMATNTAGRGDSVQRAAEFVHSYRVHEIVVRRERSKSSVGAFAHGEVFGAPGGGENDDADSRDDAEEGEDRSVTGYTFVALSESAFDGDSDPHNTLLVQ